MFEIPKHAPETEDELEEMLSSPNDRVLATLAKISGDIVILGVGGKMGLTLARMAKRACDALGDTRQIFGVARFSDRRVYEELERAGIVPIVCDLLNGNAVQSLPDAPNMIFMAGQKFGTQDAPERTWAMNTIVPMNAAQKYKDSRIVVFSTGCVYANSPIDSGGSIESDPLEPLGEYANSCVGRERIFGYFAQEFGTQVLQLRLNYAIDLRYGVLLDLAQKIITEKPIDLTMGYVNVIWQGDASAMAIQCLAQTENPLQALNVTGAETLAVRELALELQSRMGIAPQFVGAESETALLSNAFKAHTLLGKPQVSVAQMLDWTAHWIKLGGRTYGKPTHYDAKDGRF